jgi:predicted RNase H-like nuclease (RuvC/YqgF family)
MISRILSIIHKLVVRQLVPTLSQVEKLREDNSELSDEIEELSSFLDEKTEKLNQLQDAHSKEVTALRYTANKRVEELNGQLRGREVAYKNLKMTYDGLLDDHKQTKKTADEALTRHAQDMDEYKRMLSDSKILVSRHYLYLFPFIWNKF